MSLHYETKLHYINKKGVHTIKIKMKIARVYLMYRCHNKGNSLLINKTSPTKFHCCSSTEIKCLHQIRSQIKTLSVDTRLVLKKNNNIVVYRKAGKRKFKGKKPHHRRVVDFLCAAKHWYAA
jgi:hypothetical protein